MPLNPPPGFQTKATASKHYIRSPRSIENDVEKARLADDKEFLSQCIYYTKSKQKLKLSDVSAEEASELMHGGQAPLLCLSIDLLDKLYRKRINSEVADLDRDGVTAVQPVGESAIDRLQNDLDDSVPSAQSNDEFDNTVNQYEERIKEKEDYITFLKDQIVKKDEQLADKNRLEKERNELEEKRIEQQEQTNQLMRELGVSVGKLQAGESNTRSTSNAKRHLPIIAATTTQTGPVNKEQAGDKPDTPSKDSSTRARGASDEPADEVKKVSKKKRKATTKSKPKVATDRKTKKASQRKTKHCRTHPGKEVLVAALLDSTLHSPHSIHKHQHRHDFRCNRAIGSPARCVLSAS